MIAWSTSAAMTAPGGFGRLPPRLRRTRGLNRSCYLGRFWPNEAKFHNVFNARVCARNFGRANLPGGDRGSAGRSAQR